MTTITKCNMSSIASDSSCPTDADRSLCGDRSGSSDATQSLAFVNGRWRCNDIADLDDLNDVIVEKSRLSYISEFIDPYQTPSEGYADSYKTVVSIMVYSNFTIYLYQTIFLDV